MPPPPLVPLLLPLLLSVAAVATEVRHSPSFSLDFFPGAGDGAVAQLALSAAKATSAGAVSMLSPHARVHYHKPIHFAAGFSTYFSFSLTPSPSPKWESSLAFFLTPAAAAAAPKADPLLAVVFFADADPTRIRIQIDLVADTPRAATIPFPRAQKLHSWIDYNATSAKLQVCLSASGVPKPPRALLSYPLRLDTLLRGRRSSPILAGFASQAANCTLFSWAFRADPYLMHSQPLDPTGLPTTPPAVRLHSDHDDTPPRYRYPSWVSLLLAAACGALLTFFLLFAWYSVGTQRRGTVAVAPVDPSDVVYEKIVLVGVKHDAHVAVAAAANK